MIVPRDLIPFATNDVSALAKSLRAQLASRNAPPTHVEMLNMLARATGHRNFQHFRAATPDRTAPECDKAGTRTETDDVAVMRAARYFDAEGRLQSWPAHTSLQNLCVWAIWSRIPRGKVFEERSINILLGGLHLFGDHAIIRRTMCELGLIMRTHDGREYRRVERPPSPEAALLIHYLGQREVPARPRPAPRRQRAVPAR